MRSGEEIQRALRAFSATWQGFRGGERAEAQTFLNDLLACYGTDRRAVGVQFELFTALGAGFMDMLWPELCLVEMKAPSVPVASAQGQVERYWRATSNHAAGQRAALNKARFVVMARHGKRAMFTWSPREVLASDATKVFAVDNDYCMGLLMSKTHESWSWHQSGTFKADLRYTTTSTFMTLAWPYPVTLLQRERVASASQSLLARRGEICVVEQIGLTTLYNAVQEGAWADLKALHLELDRAVAACYGWPARVAQDDDEIVRRLTDLNRQIVSGEREYAPFG